MENDVKISIAMATFNGGQFIQEQLNSLAKQKKFPDELVVCDDGSTDETLDILTNFSKKSPFVVRIYKNEKRLGHHKNFLKAASLCEGDWIAYCDQDDFWLNKKIETIASIINEFPDSNLVVHVARIVDEELNFVGQKFWPRIKRLTVREPLTGSCVSFLRNSGHACIFKAQLFKELYQKACCSNRRFPICDTVSHDFWISLLAHTFGKVIYVPNVLVFHRRHTKSLTRSGSDTRFGYSARTAFGIGASTYRAQSSICIDYADFLDYLVSKVEQKEHNLLKEQAIKGKHYYQTIGQILEQRATIYDHQFVQRVIAFGKLILSGAYIPDPIGYGLGIKAFAKDFTRTLIGAYLDKK